MFVCTHSLADSLTRAHTHKHAHAHDLYAYIRTDDHSARSAHEAYNLKKEEAKVVHPQTPRGSRMGRDATPSPAVARLQLLLVQSQVVINASLFCVYALVFINASLRVCRHLCMAGSVCVRAHVCIYVCPCLSIRVCVYIEFK